MAASRNDLPLERDASARVLPWVIAVMVYLATLALAGSIATHGALSRWSAGLAGKATVQIDPAPEQEMARRLRLALEVLRTAPGVIDAQLMPRERLAELLEPWLGKGNVAPDLPVPELIDVSIDPNEVDLVELARRIEGVGAGVRLDDHTLWTRGLIVGGRSIQALALIAVVLIGFAAVAIVVFATRAGFAAHFDVIELLHLMGARDDYIARQFQRHFRWLSLKGGLVGLALAGATLALLGHFAGEVEGPLLPHLALGWIGWAFLAVLPPAAVLVATATARFTVMRALRRLP